MTSATVASKGHCPTAERDCRVSERFECDVPVSCQPPSGWGGREIKWQARVRDVSSGGLGLVLQRRFERGAGLAIDLPATDDSPACTILARVMNVRSERGGTWLLGCAFLSPLSEEELLTLRGSIPEDSPQSQPVAPSATKAAAILDQGKCLSGVHFRGRLPAGGIIHRYIKTLDVGAVWPPQEGSTFGLRFRGPAGEAPAARVRIDACRSSQSGWVLECTFLTEPSAGLLEAHTKHSD